MRVLSRILGKLHRNEDGQIIVLVGAMITALIGFSALAIDVGSLVSDKRDLQNAADAMALAGAQGLPSQTDAVAIATQWAGYNGVSESEIFSIQVQQQSLPSVPNPKITVTLHRQHHTVLARVLGVDSVDVDVTAAAIKTNPGGSDHLTPWSVLESALAQIVPGDLATLKYDSNNSQQGNFQPIRIDGSGHSYEETLANTSIGTVCSVVAMENGCVPTAVACTGATCPTQTGNMPGPTKQGLDAIYAGTDAACTNFDQVFTSNGDGTYRINSECNPFISGSLGSRRVLLVPVIQSLCNGTCDVTITQFAVFFLEGTQSKCTGSNCEIRGRFVRANFTTGAAIGVYDASSLMHFIKLVE